MSDIAIRCEGLGKKYRRGESAPYLRFSEALSSLAHTAARPFLGHRTNRRTSSPDNHAATDTLEPPDPAPATPTTPDHDWFWALKDINFEVKKGEVLGIIGRNGAGKSTLLKILSRITEPTTGHADLYGRVGSLLEVGTGFHPELTGRENIYLNGAVLGMTRPEIRKKFDEIVDFAGVEDFLDTPVKRYSSGMQTRLGFSVAAHLEPEILIVDEVLAVGDAEFQKKCLGKMDDVAKSGRTVLFVSHNMAAAGSLCQRIMLIQRGNISTSGDPHDVINIYLAEHALPRNSDHSSNTNQSEHFQFLSINTGSSSDPTHSFSQLDDIPITIEYIVSQSCPNPSIAIQIVNSTGHIVFTSFDDDANLIQAKPLGRQFSCARIPRHLLKPDAYTVNVAAKSASGSRLSFVDSATRFYVNNHGMPGAQHGSGRKGVIRPMINWTNALSKTEVMITQSTL